MTTQPHYQLQATLNGPKVRDLIEALQKLDPDLIAGGIESVRRDGNGLSFDSFPPLHHPRFRAEIESE